MGYILDWFKSRSLKFHRDLAIQIWLQIPQEEGLSSHQGLKLLSHLCFVLFLCFSLASCPSLGHEYLLHSARLLVADTTPNSLFFFFFFFQKWCPSGTDSVCQLPKPKLLNEESSCVCAWLSVPGCYGQTKDVTEHITQLCSFTKGYVKVASLRWDMDRAGF